MRHTLHPGASELGTSGALALVAPMGVDDVEARRGTFGTKLHRATGVTVPPGAPTVKALMIGAFTGALVAPIAGAVWQRSLRDGVCVRLVASLSVDQCALPLPT